MVETKDWEERSSQVFHLVMDLLSDYTVKLQTYHKVCLASTVTSFSKGCRNREPGSLLLSWPGELRNKQLKLLNIMYDIMGCISLHGMYQCHANYPQEIG